MSHCANKGPTDLLYYHECNDHYYVMINYCSLRTLGQGLHWALCECLHNFMAANNDLINPHHLMRLVLLLPLCSWGSWGSDIRSNLQKSWILGLINGRSIDNLILRVHHFQVFSFCFTVDWYLSEPLSPPSIWNTIVGCTCEVGCAVLGFCTSSQFLSGTVWQIRQ